MGWLGGLLGQGLGALGSTFFPIKGIDGATLGQNIGSYAPFKRGGKVIKVRNTHPRKIQKKKKNSKK